jgi:hypothetical protein
MTSRRAAGVVVTVGLCVVTAACGSDRHHRSPPKPAKPKPVATTATTASKPKPSSPPQSPSPNALQAEANSAATGDIPDNQVFITFRNAAARYSLKYPEGWAQQGAGGRVTFRDKNNIVRVVVAAGTVPSAAVARRAVAHLAGTTLRGSPRIVTIGSAPALALVYATKSAPNPVTGKRVTLLVDRYYLAHSGRVAVVDLGTPEGVDNVDAYRLMIESFRWR